MPEPGVDIPTSAWDDLLDHVLIHQDVEVFWQPILDLRGPSVVGYEGFARFAGATGLSPDRWFSEAATRGRRSELEALALRAALRRLGDAPRNCFLSLNVSPHALLDDHVQRALFDVPDLSGVVIELTAPTQPEDIDELARRAGPLRRAGAALALTYTVDDTTHEELLSLRPKVLKIAEPIVADMRRANHDRDRETGEALSRLAGSFGGRIVVQNVERMQDLVELCETSGSDSCRASSSGFPRRVGDRSPARSAPPMWGRKRRSRDRRRAGRKTVQLGCPLLDRGAPRRDVIAVHGPGRHPRRAPGSSCSDVRRFEVSDAIAIEIERMGGTAVMLTLHGIVEHVDETADGDAIRIGVSLTFSGPHEQRIAQTLFSA